MRRIKIFMIVSLFPVLMSAQALDEYSFEEDSKRTCLTVGIMNGGGSLLGADLEFLLGDRIGLQVGAGLTSLSAGLNFHLKPNIESSFITFQYWHQGFGDMHVQDVLGPAYVFRGKKWFTAQIGLGAALDKGPAYPEDITQPDVMLTYAIGAYIPW